MPEDILERGMRDCGNNAVEKSADSDDGTDDDDDVDDDKDDSHSPGSPGRPSSRGSPVPGGGRQR